MTTAVRLLESLNQEQRSIDTLGQADVKERSHPSGVTSEHLDRDGSNHHSMRRMPLVYSSSLSGNDFFNSDRLKT